MDCCRKTSTNSRAGDNRVVGRAGRRVASQSMQPAAGCSCYTVQCRLHSLCRVCVVSPTDVPRDSTSPVSHKVTTSYSTRGLGSIVGLSCVCEKVVRLSTIGD